MNLGLAIAAFFSLVTFGVHTFLGGPVVARPLLESQISSVPKYTQYYCWHIVTIVLVGMSGGFAYGALYPSGLDVAVFMTLLAVAFLVWNLVLIAWKYRRPWLLPQWVLFLAISTAALAGLV